MKRKPIAASSKLCVLFALLVTTGPTASEAAPLGYIILEGRTQGTTSWLRHLLVVPGDVVEYRLLVDLAPVGSTNGTNTINSTANSGFQSLSLQIKQDPAMPIQVSFNPPLSDPNSLASFRNGWADGTGASAGAATPRAGGTGNDLTGIRPVHAAGVFSGVDPEVVLTNSTFTVTRSPAGGLGMLAPSWGTVSGAMRINGAGQIFITPSGLNSPDPLIEFVPLRFGIPEPATGLLAVLGVLAGFVFVRRRKAK